MGKKDDPNEPEPITSRIESNLPLMFRYRGTVFTRIWWQILCVVSYTCVIVYCHKYVDGMRIKFPYVLIQLMGVVCGLLLVFRTNTAYDRYWEGRKTWSTMTQGIRTLTRLIWVNVNVNVKEEGSKDIIEKKSAINLLVAFAIATKHYLREEYSYDYDDLKNITGHILRFHTPSSTRPMTKQDKPPTSGLDQADSTGAVFVDIDQPPPPPTTPLPTEESGGGTREAPPSDKKSWRKGKKAGKKGGKKRTGETTDEESEIELKTKKRPRIVKAKSSTISVKSEKGYKFRAHDIATPTNIPIELSYYIASYINWLKVRDRCDSGTLGAMSSALNSMMECLTTFERILRTPIPLAYSVHLHQSIWLYILALPFQLVGGDNGLGWYTVLIVGITSFFLLGILGIGWEIENPFGYDDNDLPLDDFCKVLRREIEVIVSQRPLNPAEWIFTAENKPFAPENCLDAIELSGKPVEDVMEIMVNRGSQINLNHNLLFEYETVETIVDGKKKSVKRRKPSSQERHKEEEEQMIP